MNLEKKKKKWLAYQVKVVLVVEVVLLGKEITKGRVAQSDSLVGAKLEHGNSIGGREGDARNL